LAFTLSKAGITSKNDIQISLPDLLAFINDTVTDWVQAYDTIVQERRDAMVQSSILLYASVCGRFVELYNNPQEKAKTARAKSSMDAKQRSVKEIKDLLQAEEQR
jgi:hypothetical protein